MILLENDKISLKIALIGGAYTDFHLKGGLLNPINWSLEDETNPPFKGHFLCFDRWGPPSEGERREGFHHHGEVNSQHWQLSDLSGSSCVMRCSLPMGKLELTRQVTLPSGEPLFVVSEKIRNLNSYGRMFNIVQHVTLAPPFLDKGTLIDNNTEKGFEDKEDGSLHQEKPVLHWPEAIHNGKRVNLRQIEDPWPRVSSFVYNRREKYGWVTALNPHLELMVGYLWRTGDYPWINFWRSMKNCVPTAFGMEFGTTGLHEPFPVVARKGKIFNRNLYDFIDAGETVEKRFIAFLATIPNDYKGVETIRLENSALIIGERGRSDRQIRFRLSENCLNAGQLMP